MPDLSKGWDTSCVTNPVGGALPGIWPAIGDVPCTCNPLMAAGEGMDCIEPPSGRKSGLIRLPLWTAELCSCCCGKSRPRKSDPASVRKGLPAKGSCTSRSLHLACNIQGTVFSAKTGIRIHRYLIQKEPAKSVTAGLLTFKIKVLSQDGSRSTSILYLHRFHADMAICLRAICTGL